MKTKLIILISILLFFGCTISKRTDKLSINKDVLYPIGAESKWGFTNSKGETVIPLIYESVGFYNNGLALVKSNGKYGYLKKDGRWQIKPKYTMGTPFISNCALVSIKNDTFYINRKGERVKVNDCHSVDGGACKIVSPVNPNKYFFKVNGKYEIAYKYYLVYDSVNHKEIIDTMTIGIDEITAFGHAHILIKKNNKYGLYNIWPEKRLVFEVQENRNYQETSKLAFLKRINFVYDEVKFDKPLQSEVSYAKVKINDKWGVIDNRGNEVIEIQYNSVNIKRGGQMALIEFEKGRFGYKKYNGEEYFKRKR